MECAHEVDVGSTVMSGAHMSFYSASVALLWTTAMRAVVPPRAPRRGAAAARGVAPKGWPMVDRGVAWHHGAMRTLIRRLP